MVYVGIIFTKYRCVVRQVQSFFLYNFADFSVLSFAEEKRSFLFRKINAAMDFTDFSFANPNPFSVLWKQTKKKKNIQNTVSAKPWIIAETAAGVALAITPVFLISLILSPLRRASERIVRAHETEPLVGYKFYYVILFNCKQYTNAIRRGAGAEKFRPCRGIARRIFVKKSGFFRE